MTRIPWNKGKHWSQEVRDKISKAKKGKVSTFIGKKHSEESKIKMSESWKYENHFNKDICNKISESNKNVIHYEEWNKKVSESLKGRKLSEEHCKNISLNHADFSGINHPMYGKHHNEETKKKWRMIRKGRPSSRRGCKLSEETKRKISESRIGENNPIFKSNKFYSRGNGDYYKTPLQGVKFLRSSYEIKYAQYLDSNKILWMYETETFNLGKTSYTPDFFLPSENKFVEIKGWMKPEDKKKIEMFLEQYPWDLDVLMKEDLKNLGIKV